MFWKQLYISVLIGAFLGTFCAFGYMELTPPQNELVEIESRQEVPVQAPTPVKFEALEVVKKEVDIPAKEHIEANKIEEKEEIDIEEPQKVVLKHSNKALNNYNIMFFGIEDNILQMLTVYSINKENKWKSGTVFIPTDTMVPGTKGQYLADYFYQNGTEKVVQFVENAMEININYYVKVDRNLLLEVEPYLDPIYVEGKKINLSQLFTKEITPQDEIILASLLKNLTKPSVYFGVLPKLVLTCKQYITTDFELNWTNLWLHYQIAKNIDTTAVTKKIISGKYQVLNNKKYWIPTQDAWWNMVCFVTK